MLTGRSDVRGFFETLFKNQGYSSVCTHSEKEALGLHRRNPFGLVALDITDMQEDMLVFSKKLRTVPLGEDTYFLAVTSGDNVTEIMSAVECFADDFIRHPCDESEAEARLVLAEKRIQQRCALRRKNPMATLDIAKTVFPHAQTGCVMLESIRDSEGEIRDFQVNDVNIAFESAIGLRKNLVVGQCVSEIFPDIGSTLVKHATNATTGKVIRFKLDYKRLDKHFDVSFFCSDPDRVFVSFLETTDIHLAEEALRNSEKRFQQTLDALPDIVYELAMDGTIVYANSSASESLQIPLSKIGDMSINDILSKEDQEFAFENMAEMIETGKPKTGHRYNLLKADGTNLPVEAHAILIERENRTPTVLGIARDITERLDREQERLRLEEQIRKTQRLQSLKVLAGGLAHDFNNLLVVILGNAALAKTEMRADSRSFKHLQRIETAARRAAGLTDQMLAYAGKGQTSMEPVDLGKTVEEMSRLLQVSMTQGQEIDWQSDGTTPFIKADPTQIRQIVINLIINAAEAGTLEDSNIYVRTGSVFMSREDLASTYVDDGLSDGMYSYLQIRDTGCGMDNSIKNRMFEPFFTTKFTGRGMGLAAVLGIIRSHKGAVSVETEPEKGTMVTVYFPQIVKPISRPVPAFKEKQTVERGWGTILVVEYQKNVMEVAREILESAGYRVLTAINSREGIRTLEQNNESITAVLLDLLIPQRDGDETLQRMIELKPDLPIILSGGYTYKEAMNRFSVKASAGYIKKPYDPETLLSAVSEAAASNQNRN